MCNRSFNCFKSFTNCLSISKLFNYIFLQVSIETTTMILIQYCATWNDSDAMVSSFSTMNYNKQVTKIQKHGNRPTRIYQKLTLKKHKYGHTLTNTKVAKKPSIICQLRLKRPNSLLLYDSFKLPFCFVLFFYCYLRYL